jgi:hypothetical protein
MMECKDGVFDWSRTFSSPLEMNKLALVNFAHSQPKISAANDLSLDQSTPDGIIHHSIKGKQQAKLLGVILNSKLNWAAQQEKVREKATKFTTAFKRYTKAAKLYKAVVVPRICCASNVWYKPPHKKEGKAKSRGSVRFTGQLESIQRQAAISITGAMLTTAGDAAIVHANIKPIALQLKETGLKNYARLASRPAYSTTPSAQRLPKLPNNWYKDTKRPYTHWQPQAASNPQRSRQSILSGRPQAPKARTHSESPLARKKL